MASLFPLTTPAILVMVAAFVLVRRERRDRPPVDDLGEVPVVPAALPAASRAAARRRLGSTDGALVMPSNRSLGARLVAAAPPERRPVRVRHRPLRANRAA